MLLIYNLLIHCYGLCIRVAALGNLAARRWLAGRSSNQQKLIEWRQDVDGPVVWVHCASHGEYEQVLPLITLIRSERSEILIALTFFSPSGYDAVVKSAPAHWVGYIPLDTRKNMAHFIGQLDPSVAIFVKNEWWWNALALLRKEKIPTHIVSTTIRQDHYFVKYHIGFITQILASLSSVGTVDDVSGTILRQAYPNIFTYKSGDMRIDRVEQIASSAPDPWLAQLMTKDKVIIYGSVWESDIPAIKLLVSHFSDYSHILFPHQVDDKNVWRLQHALQAKVVDDNDRKLPRGVYLVPKMGILSQAYQYAKLAYVGGGYGAGIHNILEAAVYRIPVIIGPKYQKSSEAKMLRELGVVTVLSPIPTLADIIDLQGEEDLKSVENATKQYFKANTGATVVTYNHIFGYSQKTS